MSDLLIAIIASILFVLLIVIVSLATQWMIRVAFEDEKKRKESKKSE